MPKPSTTLPVLVATLCAWAVATALLLPTGGIAGDPAAATQDGEAGPAIPTLALPDGCTLKVSLVKDDKQVPTGLLIEGTNPTNAAVEIDARLRYAAQDMKSMISRMPQPTKYHRGETSCTVTIAADGSSSTTVAFPKLPEGFNLGFGGGVELVVGERILLVHGAMPVAQPGALNGAELETLTQVAGSATEPGS